MAADLHYEIVSPERLLADAHAHMVVVPGTDGDFAVLDQHAPFMSTIRPGVISIYRDDAATVSEQLFVRGGLAQVAPQGLTILAEETISLPEASVDDLSHAISALNQDLAREQDPAKKSDIEAEIDWRQTLIAILETS